MWIYQALYLAKPMVFQGVSDSQRLTVVRVLKDQLAWICLLSFLH